MSELRRIARYTLPGLRTGLVIFICILATSLLGLVPPFLMRAVIDSAIPHGDGRALNSLVALMIAAPTLAGLIGVWQRHLVMVMGQNIILGLRREMYASLLRQSLRFFTDNRPGEVLSRLHNDISGVQSTVSATFVTLTTNVVVLCATLVVLLNLDWRLTLVASAVFPLLLLPTRHVGRVRKDISKERQERVAEFVSRTEETLSIRGFMLTRLFGAHDYEIERFQEKAEALRVLQIRQSQVGRWYFMFLAMFGTVGPALIYWVGGHAAIAGRLTTGTLVAFVVYLGRLYGPVLSLASAHVEIMSAVASFRRIFAYLDLPAEIGEPAVPTRIARPQGDIRFEGVSLEYQPGVHAVEDVTFQVQPGKIVALVGPSGAGKTTLAYLASRLYDPTKGRVTFDGIDLRELSLDDLSRWVANVTQDSTLLHATIDENLRYAKPDATREEIERACRLAHIHEMVDGLPDGYATLVGEGGFRLSGGERQRLALARVILRDPKVIILDEATSSVDAHTEAIIQEALKHVLSNRTTLIIAHRLNTVVRADQILVVDSGRIVERGTHDDLLQHNGLYAKLHREHFGTERSHAL